MTEYRRHDAVLPASADAIVNETINGIDAGGVESLTASIVGFALGKIPAERVANQFSSLTGCGLVAGAAKVATIQAVNQAQSDDYLVTQHGISRGELPDVYEFARGRENKEALNKAITDQIYAKRMDGYKGLVNAYMNKTAPSAQALNASGIETKLSADGKELVKVQGMWMQSKVASMNGWI